MRVAQNHPVFNVEHVEAVTDAENLGEFPAHYDAAAGGVAADDLKFVVASAMALASAERGEIALTSDQAEVLAMRASWALRHLVDQARISISRLKRLTSPRATIDAAAGRPIDIVIVDHDGCAA